MKKLHLLTFSALIMIGLSGCKKEKVENIASADVFVKAIKDAQGATVYTAIHSVFSYSKMTSVGVHSSASSSVVQLNNFENGGNSFFNVPLDADYLPAPPMPGTYTYLVKFKAGEEKSYTNSLSTATLLPANITSLTRTVNRDSVYISWDAIANVDFYEIKGFKGETQVFFAQKLYDPSNPKKQNIRFGFSLTNLPSSFYGTYTFYLSGLLYETTAYDYLQAISTSTKEIVLL